MREKREEGNEIYSLVAGKDRKSHKSMGKFLARNVLTRTVVLDTAVMMGHRLSGLGMATAMANAMSQATQFPSRTKESSIAFCKSGRLSLT